MITLTPALIALACLSLLNAAALALVVLRLARIAVLDREQFLKSRGLVE